MQDDPRRQLDAFADGPRHDQPASTVLDGHPNSNQPLTESNLDRHTRIHPPDARDTVAWYLRGLQGGTGTSTSATNVQAPAKQQVSQTLECHRIPVNRSEVELQAGCEKPIDPKGSPSKYPTAEEPVLSLQAIPSGLSGAKLVEARRLLVASIRSKHDPLEQVTRKSAPPASTGSTQSSTKQLLPRPQDLPKNTSNDRENVYEKASAVDQSQDRIEARRKSKRKLSDPGVVVGRRPKPRSKIAHSPTEPVQAGHDNLTAVQKAKEDHRRRE